jgi:hypothetical protein
MSEGALHETLVSLLSNKNIKGIASKIGLRPTEETEVDLITNKSFENS